jgi:hypothetical protein
MTEVNNDKTGAETDYINTIGKVGYLLLDEQLITFLAENEFLNPLIALLSPVNSTSNLSKFEADLKRLRIENFFTMLKLTMPPEMYEKNGMEWLESLRLYSFDRVSDAENGWKGHIATEHVKVILSGESKKNGVGR